MTKQELRTKRHETYLKLQATNVQDSQYKQVLSEYNQLCEQWNKLIGIN